jgi:hypothetical protein
MRKYVAKKGGMYVNYISLFSSKPFRLRDTTILFTAGGREARQQPHIIYTEKEARVLINLVRDIKIIEV